MIASRILNAMKICMEQIPDDKLLPVIKALICIWDGDSDKYREHLLEFRKKFPKDIENVEKEQ